MKQTLKATAAIIGIIAAGLTFKTAINTPLIDDITETLTAVTAICAAALIITLAGYVAKLIINSESTEKR